MKTGNGKTTTPLEAAKLVYVNFGQQAEFDCEEALQYLDIEMRTPEEFADFRKHLQAIDKRVRKLLHI